VKLNVLIYEELTGGRRVETMKSNTVNSAIAVKVTRQSRENKAKKSENE
jgi:hypothetical protein